jgi:hypothetical protein
MKKPTHVECFHREWKIPVTGESLAACAALLGCPHWDLEIIQVLEGDDALLRDVPHEFKSVLSGMAYDQGHNAGEEECWGILSGLVYDLLPCIQAFEARVRAHNTP